jgi:hypothetical protein
LGTFPGLVRAAQNKGLFTAESKIGIDDLEALKSPAIAMLWDNHFVLINGQGQGKITITDPTDESKPMPIDEFKNAYSGMALVVAKDKNDLPEYEEVKRPDLRISEYVTDFGEADQGDVVNRYVEIWNAGKKYILISSIRGTCVCTRASVPRKLIPPQGHELIDITFDTSGRQGMQHPKIYINSNDPVTPIAQVALVGSVITPIVTTYPSSVDFGVLDAGESPSRRIDILDCGVRDFKVIKAESDSPFIVCTVSATGEEAHPRYEVTINLSKDASVGKLDAKIIITTNHPKSPTVEVPVTANIR